MGFDDLQFSKNRKNTNQQNMLRMLVPETLVLLLVRARVAMHGLCRLPVACGRVGDTCRPLRAIFNIYFYENLPRLTNISVNIASLTLDCVMLIQK